MRKIKMLRIKQLIAISLLSFSASLAIADGCCNRMGGISYCDSSAGRLVCNNGFYSACYCTRHAVMDLQLLKGCCLWRGGVQFTYADTRVILCNDGSISEECSLQLPAEKVATW